MKKRFSKNVLTSGLLVVSLMSLPTMAENTMPAGITAVSANTYELTSPERKSQQRMNENIGFGSGLVLGAIVAGPIGAIVAGVTGTLIASHMNAKEDVNELSGHLSKVTKEHEQTIVQYQQEIKLVEQSYESQLAALDEQANLPEQLAADNLLMSLQFSTGSSDIAPHYQEQVSALAQILNNSPEMKIDLSGYTDLMGEEELNHALSVARVESVKSLLMAQGVNSEQIETFAYGENAPLVATKNQEVSFYDRRVVLKLHKPLTRTAKR